MLTHFRTTRIATVLMAWIAVSASAPQSVGVEATTGPALWQVSHGDTKVYLFGLPNLMDADTQWRNATFDAALAEASAVILEADRSSPEAQAAMQHTVQQLGVFLDGRSLDDIIEADVRTQVRTVAASLGIPAQALTPLKPWLAANQLQSVAMQQAGLAGAQTPNAVIASEAVEAGKRISHLEEPTALLATIGSLPEDSQKRMLQQALDAIENDPEQARRILSLWAAGDVDELAEALHGDGEWADATVRSVVLLERNALFQARLEEILTTETGVYFVAVGVGHLVGDDSIVAGLEAAGYEVVRR